MGRGDPNGVTCCPRREDGGSGHALVRHQRIFPTVKRVIVYYPGDLRALQKYPDWKKLAGVTDPVLLGSALMVQGEVTILSRRARRYTGRVDGQEIEVLWLEQEQLPTRVQRISKEYQEIVELKEIYPLEKSPWPRLETVGYESIDYADVGDKEADPFIRTFLHGGGLAHEHSHKSERGAR